MTFKAQHNALLRAELTRLGDPQLLAGRGWPLSCSWPGGCFEMP